MAPLSCMHEPVEEASAASVVVTEAVAVEDIQVDPGDSISDRRNAFLPLVFRPLLSPILATPAPRQACAPMEVANTPRRSGRIKKLKLKRKDANNGCSATSTQESLARALGLLEENAEFDDTTLAAYIDKFKTLLSPRSITMLGGLVKNMEKLKNPNAERLAPRRRQLSLSNGCKSCNLCVE